MRDSRLCACGVMAAALDLGSSVRKDVQVQLLSCVRMYTKQEIEKAVAESFSVAEVLRMLGIKPAGGSHSHMKRRIDRLGLNTSHFTGQRGNKGKTPVNRKTADDILILREEKDHRNRTAQLTRALHEIERPYECERCQNPGEWNGHPLTLQIDHANGQCWDDRRENLRWLCPNCHSQCPTSKSKKVFVIGKSLIGGSDLIDL